VPRLSFAPLIGVTPNSRTATHNLRVTSVWEPAIHACRWYIANAQGATQAAKVTAMWDVTSASWGVASVDIASVADSVTAAHLNRLMVGTGLPRLEGAGKGVIVMRWPGKPLGLPLTVNGNLATHLWTLGSGASALQTPTPPPSLPTPPPPPPQAPVLAPPVGPSIVAPVLAAIDVPEHHDPRPEPEPEPEPIRIVPAAIPAASGTCGCPVGACVFEYPDPKALDPIIVTTENAAILTAALAKHAKGLPTRVILTGPTGTGKTELVRDIAANAGIPLHVFDGAGANTFDDWFGTVGLIPAPDGHGAITEFLPSAFLQAIRADGPHGDERRIVLVDEVNRAASSGALNALMGILTAHRVSIPAAAGKTFPVSRNVLFMFTMNRGSQYGGTVTLDAALADRMQTWVRTEYLDNATEAGLVRSRTGISEDAAGVLVTLATQIRAIADRGEVRQGISTRKVLDAAQAVACGLTLRLAAESTWANAYDDEGAADSERGIVLTSIRATLP
jgi:MoxR-like ATPase